MTGLKDDCDKLHVARGLAQVASNFSVDRILRRLESLPWTLTSSASAKTAHRLLELLEGRGAVVQVIPPLPDSLTGELTAAREVPKEDYRFESAAAASVESPEAPAGPSASQAVSREPSDVSEQNLEPPTRGFEIEPLGLGGILDRAFNICRAHFWKLLAISAIPWLLIPVILLLVLLSTATMGVVSAVTLGLKKWSWLLVFSVIVLSAAGISVFYLAQGAMIHAVSRIYLGLEVQVRQAYRFALGRLARLIFTSLLFLLVVFGSLVAALLFFGLVAAVASPLVTQVFGASRVWIAPLWIVAGAFLLLVPTYAMLKLLLFDKVVIIERLAYGQALRRSWALLRGKADGSWPRGYLLRLVILLNLFVLISVGISYLFSAPTDLIARLFPESLMMVKLTVSAVLRSLGQLVAGFFGSVCLVIFYYDIRNRKEGFDLKMLAGSHEGEIC
jgi:hypothetical protein